MRLFRSLLFIFMIAGFVSAGCMRPPSVDQDMPVVSGDTLAEAWVVGKLMTTYISWTVIALSALMQLLAFIMALRKLKSVTKSDLHPANQLMQLDVVEVYFDLPLYFGLLGTVLSFIIITLYPDAGLMFAYVSTAFGIIVSVVLRLGFLVPCKQRLLTRKQENR